ncbi:uncharacterized LOC103579078 isoform X1 [Microplitis demolitor]|uniref:uncharacterized LOC103579078 isoform X1 n=1 Tax=Microplitis demolitor TaxID=69319 RepID=UPI0004CDADEC|nr:uncharacterized LOC103579078 isoform X1 [Microplitis demolitor]
MEDEFATVVSVEVVPNIFVPIEWPIEGLENLIVTLAKKIIARFNFLSPIVQVKNIPTRLIRRIYMNTPAYFFQKVSKKEMIGAYVYNIVLPKEGNSILIEINSGSNINNGSCQNYPVKVPSEITMTSYSLMPSRFMLGLNKYYTSSKETSRDIDDNKLVLRRRLLRKMKRTSHRVRKCHH